MLEAPKRTGRYMDFGRCYSFVQERRRSTTCTDYHDRPDRCDGSYDQYCGTSPKFDSITDILESFGQGELVEYMNRYWVAK